MESQDRVRPRLVPGRTYTTGERVVTKEEILQFASRYDPLPLHTDEGFAQRSRFGTLIAPGFMGVAVAWELWVKTFYREILDHSFGVGVSLTDLRWLKPLRAGDRVWARVQVLSDSGPLRDGLVTVGFRFELYDSGGDLLLTFRTHGIAASEVLATRDDGPIVDQAETDAAPGPGTLE